MIPKVTWIDSYLDTLMDGKRFIPYDVKTVLDIGCGKGTLGAVIRNCRDIEYMCGIDAYEPYLKFAARQYDRTILWDLNKGLPSNIGKFDLAIATETIEHLDRNVAFRILDDVEKIAKYIIIGFPHYTNPQGELDGNPFQKHKSSFTIRELRDRGYVVWGVSKLMIPKLKIVIPVECPWLQRFPSIHHTLLARKVVAHEVGGMR